MHQAIENYSGHACCTDIQVTVWWAFGCTATVQWAIDEDWCHIVTVRNKLEKKHNLSMIMQLG